MYDCSFAGRKGDLLRAVGRVLGTTLLSLLAGCGGDAPSEPSPFPSPETPTSTQNTAPIFTSSATVSVLENTTVVAGVTTSDAQSDTITYSVAGGVDAERFDIDAHTGELRFKEPADFDAPLDSNQNNVYVVTIAASDGVTTTWQTLDVTVTGVGLTVEVKPGYIKTLSFRWNAVNGTTYYKLLVNPDGKSGYTQVGADLTATQSNVTLPVHMTDWVNSRYVVEGYNDQGQVFRSKAKAIDALMLESIGYVKASNTDWADLFGSSVALSADGTTLAVGAWRESSGDTGVDGNQDDNSADEAGAVYVYANEDGVWLQQAYIKATNTDARDFFGNSVTLSADGQILAIGAPGEDSGIPGIDGNQLDNSAGESGAVYLYVRTGTVWAQQAYIKASNADEDDFFGNSVALSADGRTLAVGAPDEESGANGVGGNESDNFADRAGAAYIFSYDASGWAQQAYVKASNSDAHDIFGYSVALSADGRTLAVGAPREDSDAVGVEGDQSNNLADDAGAVYMYALGEAEWKQQAYIKASNAEAYDGFGNVVTLSANGQLLAVGAPMEASAARGIDGDQSDNSAAEAGAVYVFARSGVDWAQQAYIKASNTWDGTTPAELFPSDFFGSGLALSADGQTLVVGAWGESSADDGVGGDQDDNTANDAGAVYVFTNAELAWRQQSYVKASSSDEWDGFGAALALSADGQTLAVGAPEEAGAETGIGGDQHSNDATAAGAVYLY